MYVFGEKNVISFDEGRKKRYTICEVTMIKNKTVITKKDVIKMQQISLLKSSWLVAIVAVALVLLAFRIRDGQFVFESVAFAVIGAAVLPLYFAIVEIMMAKQNKKLPLQTSIEYEFDSAVIKAIASDGGNSEKMEIKYSLIKKIAFDKRYITIMLDKSTSFLIDKKGFESEEDEKATEALLKAKTPSLGRKK